MRFFGHVGANICVGNVSIPFSPIQRLDFYKSFAKLFSMTPIVPHFYLKIYRMQVYTSLKISVTIALIIPESVLSIM